MSPALMSTFKALDASLSKTWLTLMVGFAFSNSVTFLSIQSTTSLFPFRKVIVVTSCPLLQPTRAAVARSVMMVPTTNLFFFIVFPPYWDPNQVNRGRAYTIIIDNLIAQCKKLYSWLRAREIRRTDNP